MTGSAVGGPPDQGEFIRARGHGPRLIHERDSALRSTLVAFVSTVVFFGFVAWVVVHAPGWDELRSSFLDGNLFREFLPSIAGAFLVNVQLFLVAEVFILAFGLVIAVMRSLSGPVFFPVRLLATLYADVFRALPGILVIYMLGFGIPSLGIAGLPTDPFVWAVISLTFIYSAYVSEVYRAGIESVHPSQEAAARSLGLSRLQAMRYVILPQAVRRVIPPLLNDFIGLQKDTVLVSYVGVVEIFRQAQITEAAHFNFTPYMDVALVFLVITIPLARFTDWLVTRDRSRSRASAT